MSDNLVKLTGQHIAELKQAFSHFWNSVVGITGSPARGITDETITVNRVDDHRLDVCTPSDSQALWFRGLPFRPGDSSRTIDAWIQFEETVRGVEENGGVRYEIERSVTRLVYAVQEREDGERIGKARQGVHFDFKELPDGNHPVFHAQFDPSCIDTSAIEEYQLQVGGKSAPSFPRVPSAPIDVAAVTYMILHDHKPNLLDEDEGWPSETHAALRKLPQFPSACFDPKPQGGNGMLCDWWYLHATSDDDGVPRREIVTR